MNVSYAIMAHPTRDHYVEGLQEDLPNVATCWDRVNNEWDTASRALAAYESDADWHVVVQDDAILCDNFADIAWEALNGIRHNGPVSFYTGCGRPYAKEIKRLVDEVTERNVPWIAMPNGPLWGVCLAFPVRLIDQMIEACDEKRIVDYDSKVCDFFRHDEKLETWYSMPSLVDHRDEAGSPSLIPGHGSSSGRVAHNWLGAGSPTDIDWTKDAYHAGDQSEYWTQGYSCVRCDYESEDLVEAIEHAADEHDLGTIEFFCTTARHAQLLWTIREKLTPKLRGIFWVGGMDAAKELPNEVQPSQVTRRNDAVQYFRRPGAYVIVGARRDFRWVHSRAGWSLDGAAK
jgi:hypothetical protein